jgi:hypothetical protein
MFGEKVRMESVLDTNHRSQTFLFFQGTFSLKVKMRGIWAMPFRIIPRGKRVS